MQKKYTGLVFITILISNLAFIKINAQVITPVTVAGGNGAGNGANQLNAAQGLFIDGNGNIYVADGDNNRVQMFPSGSTSATNGVTVAGGNGLGSAANQLHAPTSVFVDAGGNLYVGDNGNQRVQKFPPNSTSGSSATTVAAELIGTVTGVFVDADGNIYVTDELNNRVQKFPAASTATTYGVTVAGGNGFGADGHHLDYPVYTFVDAANYLYVSDNGNNRVIRFPPGSDSTTNGVVVAGGNGPDSGANQLNQPGALFVDGTGNLYVADELNNRVQKFPSASTSSTNAVTVAGGNGPGAGANQLTGPTSVWVTTSSIFVMDNGNNRVQEWPLQTTGITANPFANPHNISIYPNPNCGSFIFNSLGETGKKLAIYDVTGRLITQQPIVGDKQPIELKNLSAGYYTLQVEGDLKTLSFIVTSK